MLQIDWASVASLRSLNIYSDFSGVNEYAGHTSGCVGGKYIKIFRQSITPIITHITYIT